MYKQKKGTVTKINSICLDRRGNEKNIVVNLKKFSKAHVQLENTSVALKFSQEQIENTCFTYKFEEKSSWSRAAHNGIKDLKNSLIFSLIFISQIQPLYLVQINDQVEGEKHLFSLEGKPTQLGTHTNIMKIDGKKHSLIAIVSNEKLRTSIALPLAFDQSKNSYDIVDIDKSTPYLFKVFPLIGSETFGLPLIINSVDFAPTNEREGIILAGLIEELIQRN